MGLSLGPCTIKATTSAIGAVCIFGLENAKAAAMPFTVQIHHPSTSHAGRAEMLHVNWLVSLLARLRSRAKISPEQLAQLGCVLRWDRFRDLWP